MLQPCRCQRFKNIPWLWTSFCAGTGLDLLHWPLHWGRGRECRTHPRWPRCGGHKREHLPVRAQVCASPNGKFSSVKAFCGQQYWQSDTKLQVSSQEKALKKLREGLFDVIPAGALDTLTAEDFRWFPKNVSTGPHVRLAFKGCCWTGLETSTWPHWLVILLSMTSPGNPRIGLLPLNAGCGQSLKRWRHLRNR